MFCTKCGKKIEEGSIFCEFCGTKQADIELTKDAESTASEPVKGSEVETVAEVPKEIINKEKSRVKQNSLKNTLFSATGFLSIYRVLGYGFLIFGFFALNNNKILIPLAFIVGLSIVPIGVLFTKLIKK